MKKSSSPALTWSYSTNIMGPFGLWWFEENNIPFVEIETNSELFGKHIHKQYEPWFGGRIDCYCSNPYDPEYDHYNRELSLPIMKANSLKKLDEFLSNYRSSSLDYDLLKTFEKETGFLLELFNPDEK